MAPIEIEYGRRLTCPGDEQVTFVHRDETHAHTVRPGTKRKFNYKYWDGVDWFTVSLEVRCDDRDHGKVRSKFTKLGIFRDKVLYEEELDVEDSILEKTIQNKDAQIGFRAKHVKVNGNQ